MRKIGLLVLIAALGLTGCSSPSGKHAGRANSGSGLDAVGPNPVAILKKIPGCVVAPGTTVGDQMADVRYARCQVNDPDPNATDGDQIAVYTSNKSVALQSELTTQGGSSTDSTKIVTGDKFFLTDTGSLDPNTGSTVFYLDPQTLAESVGGTVS